MKHRNAVEIAEHVVESAWGADPSCYDNDRDVGPFRLIQQQLAQFPTFGVGQHLLGENQYTGPALQLATELATPAEGFRRDSGTLEKFGRERSITSSGPDQYTLIPAISPADVHADGSQCW
jgi:hypothetical protein